MITDPERIIAAARQVFADGIPARRPALWDGKAGDRIAEVIIAGGLAPSRKQPTEL